MSGVRRVAGGAVLVPSLAALAAALLVELQLYSKPGFVAQDEPIARRLLEGIDYAALAGLLAP